MKEAGRPYRMTARAEAAAATHERILDAAAKVFLAGPSDRMSLAEVARRAEVTVQTVIRRFGDREGLFEAALERESSRVGAQRGTAEPGDVRGAARNLAEHYEQLGDAVLRLLAEEGRSAAARRAADAGRELHRDWCARVFAPFLAGRRGAPRRRLLAQLVAVCDVHTWYLLRRQSGLSRPQTELALAELLGSLLEDH